MNKDQYKFTTQEEQDELIKELTSEKMRKYIRATVINIIPAVEVDDLIQDVLIKVYGKIFMFDPGRNIQFSTWVCHIAKMDAIQFKRKVSMTISFDIISTEYEKNIPDIPTEIDEVQDAIDKQKAKEEVELIKELLSKDSLVAKYDFAEVFIKWHTLMNMDYTFANIAEETGMSINTVKTVFKRIRQHLAKRMNKTIEPKHKGKQKLKASQYNAARYAEKRQEYLATQKRWREKKSKTQ